MKKRHALLISVLGSALAAPVWATEAPKAAEAPKTAAPAPAVAKASEELRAVLKQHHDAMNKQDLKALLALYADNPNVALMGTGPGEFWKGKAAVEDTYKHYFETFKPGSLSHECPEAAGAEDGNSAWLMASCTMKDADPATGQPREFELNVSAVLKKEKDGWRFQALHFSNLVGDDGPPPEEDAAPEEAPAAGSEPAPAAAPAPKKEAAPKKAQ